MVSFDRKTVLGVEEGYTQPALAADWNGVIAEVVNQCADTVLLVDGKEAATTESGTFYLYLSEAENTLQWMVAVDELTRLMECYVGEYDTGSILIQRGDNRLVIDAQDGSLLWNDEILAGLNAQREEGAWYLPAEALESVFGFLVEWFPNQNQITMTRLDTADNRCYPISYDYRLEGRMPEIRNQGESGDCWAFAALSALESALLPELSQQLSADHLIYNSSYHLEHNSGGSYTIALAYLLAWQGPVAEEDDPYNDGVTADAALQPLYHLQEVQFIESKDLDAIKKAVFLYGGVQTSLYMTDVNSEYYNAEAAAYCYIGTEKINHDVVIVGWDDTYPKENFTTELEGDGAFICMNSWGQEYGDEGCFYVSYYDTNIGIYNFVCTGIESADNYDNIYQTDLCGWIGRLGYGDSTAYFANVYTAQGAEQLEAVGFYALGADTTYEVYVETGVTEYDRMSMEHLVASGSLENAGFYTIPLETPQALQEGEEFVVIVKITTPGEDHPIAIELVTEDNPMSGEVDISDGEGYISAKGNYWSSAEGTQGSNVCLKVYTTDRGE